MATANLVLAISAWIPQRRDHRLHYLIGRRGWGMVLALVALGLALVLVPYGIVRLSLLALSGPRVLWL